MTMAQDYRNASMALNRTNASAAWTKRPGISPKQRDVYIDQETKTRDKMLSRYPHKYVASKRSENRYDVKQIFADGSELACPLISTEAELKWLREDGKPVEVVEEAVK